MCVKSYDSSIDHILDEIELLDIRLKSMLSEPISKNKNENNNNSYSNLFISNEQIEFLLGGDKENKSDYSTFMHDFDYFRDKIQAKKKSSKKEGVRLNLDYISEIFSLSPLENEVILICLAPEIDLKYEKIYSFLQDDVTKIHPSLNLVFDILGLFSHKERIHLRKYFLSNSNLFKYKIVHFDNLQDRKYPFLSRALVLDENVINFIFGHEQLNSQITDSSLLFTKESLPTMSLCEIYGNIKTKIFKHINSTNSYQQQPIQNFSNTLFYLQGKNGMGRKTSILSLCNEVHLNAIVVDISKALESNTDPRDLFDILKREKILHNSVLYFDNFDYLFSSDEKIGKFRNTINAKLSELSGIVFLAGDQIWDINRFFQQYVPIIVQYSQISSAIKKEIWRYFLKELHAADPLIENLVNKFTFTPLQIMNAVTAAKNISLFNNKKTIPLTIDDIYNGCFQEINKGLRVFGTKVFTKYNWNDLILSSDKKLQLLEIVDHIKNKNKVFDEWGFVDKLSRGKGLNILFTGESGTGKTMAAEIIAHELKLDLYKVDLSIIVSKYIGETEKNLNKIFQEAKTSNSILFFDEADAIFGKRTEVRDAHDRYANTEINYLLQMIEEHEEIVILTSNFAQNVDDAFIRRMRFRIDFPFPSEYERLRIWENIFPKNAPVGSDIEFTYLAKQFVIPGGLIKNIALASAFYAASNDSQITMKHLMRGIAREFQKTGKPCLKSDFGKYYDLIIK